MPSRTSQRQVEAAAVVLEHVHDPQALDVMVESPGHQLIDDFFARVPERRVTQVVSERDRFGQFLVKAQHLRDRSRDLRHLERVGEARPVVVAGRREEHLSLVLQPAERLAVDDAIAVTLKRRPHIVFGFRAQTSPRVGALRGAVGKNLALTLLELLANVHLVEIIPLCGRRAPRLSEAKRG